MKLHPFTGGRFLYTDTAASRTTADGADAVRKIVFDRFEASNENPIETMDDATIKSE